MFKKLTALLIAVSVAAATFVINVNGANSADYSGIEEKQQFLTTLDIISVNSYGETNAEEEVTRIEYAAMVGKILNINPTIAEANPYYIDINPDNWAAYTLNRLVDMGILHIDAEGRFNPYDTITVSEAVKMLDCVLGYGDYAQYKGGYPMGYLTVAREIDLLKGINNGGDDKVTRGTMIVLLYNALHTRVMDVVSIGTPGSVTNKDTDTMMKRYLNIDYIEDIVYEADGFSLTGGYTETGRCKIGDTFMDVGNIDAAGALGHSVRAYYYEEKGGDSKTLRFVSDMCSSEEVVITSENEPEYADGKLTYTDENDKRKSVQISQSALIMRNGEAISEDISAALKVSNGFITLINNDKNPGADAVIVEDYRTVLVNSANPGTMTIVDDIDKRNYIDLSKNNCENVTVYTVDGTKTTMSSIQAKAVIDVAFSKAHTIIHINSDNILGTIEAIYDGDKEIQIDGNRFKYADSLMDVYSCKVGDNALFKMNRMGKIVCMLDPALKDRAGYVIDVSSQSGVFSDVYMLKILTSEGSVEVFTFADNAKLDGIKLSAMKNPDKAVADLESNPIMYRIDSKNEITFADSPNRNSEYEDEYSLTWSGATDKDTIVLRWNTPQKKFGKKLLVDPKAVVFRVPSDRENKTESDYSIAQLSLFIDNTGYNTDLYKTGAGNYNNIVVLKMAAYDLVPATQFLWVESVSNAIDSNGENVIRVNAYRRGKLGEYDINADYGIIPDVGDVVRIGSNDKKASELVEIHYDYSEKNTGLTDPESEFGGYDTMGYWKRFSDLYHQNRLIIGYAVEVEDNILKWATDSHGSENIDEVGLVANTVPVVVYDAESGKFYSGSLSDVKGSKTYGSDCSDIIATTSYGAINALYIINNRNDY